MMEDFKPNKEYLREEFSKHYEKYYSTKLFDEKGFKRRKCKICGRYFWSISDRDVCGDHEPYSFFKEKPIRTTYEEFWEKFDSFFRKNGHKVIKRYPVVSRWRQDLYFTIASIQDFQRIENGKMEFEYSENPLIVPQICLRFTDIENVGVTGRHFTGFMMAGQHAFNWPDEGYWRDKTIELNYEFLTKVLGVKDEDLVYHEDAWAMGDFSEFGPCLESFSNGLELVNSVFTQYEYSNGMVKELPGKVVDVGWGFERLLWFYSGFDNAYYSTFSNTIEKLKGRVGLNFESESFKRFASVSAELDVTEIKNEREREAALLKQAGITSETYEKEVKPMQAFYAILDHTRTLLFAIADGALPSNVGGGYNLRIILRRALEFIDKYKFDIDLKEVARLEAAELKNLYSELYQNLDIFDKVLDIEKERFAKSKELASKTVEQLLKSKKSIDRNELKVLYESYGITPEFISNAAAKKGIRIELPENVYSGILEGDFAKKEKAKKIDVELPELPATKPLYYDYAEKASAKVLFAKKRHVVLDKTPFYPEGGGQLADHGTINGIKVVDVQKVGGIIVHVMSKDVDGELKPGGDVEAVVDVERRRRLMVHHTATHLVNACARKVLGKHVWQEGTTKDYDKARLDITHYDKLTEEQIEAIERCANGYIAEGIKVDVKEMERGDAEAKYGFTIYQGHGVPSKKLRIVTISTSKGELIDAEACGGLHLAGREQMLGMVKIINTYRAHDGIDRIEFVAGAAALDYFDKVDNELSNIAKALNAEKLGSYKAVLSNMDSYRAMYKKLGEYNDLVAGLIAKNLKGKGRIVLDLGNADRGLMRKVATQVVEDDSTAVVLLTNSNKEFVCIAGEDSGIAAIDFAKEKLDGNFTGGGKDRIAEGRLK